MVSAFIVSASGARSRFFWNIDGAVGLKSPNIDDDVQFVQLGYFFRNQAGLGTPDERAASSRIQPGELYNGQPNEPLTLAIVAHQKSRGGTQDGKISPLNKRGAYDISSGHFSQMITALGNNIMDANQGIYPRLDKLGDLCPGALKASILDGCTIPPQS